jgi:hypothetical protein
MYLNAIQVESFPRCIFKKSVNSKEFSNLFSSPDFDVLCPRDLLQLSEAWWEPNKPEEVVEKNRSAEVLGHNSPINVENVILVSFNVYLQFEFLFAFSKEYIINRFLKTCLEL